MGRTARTGSRPPLAAVSVALYSCWSYAELPIVNADVGVHTTLARCDADAVIVFKRLRVKSAEFLPRFTGRLPFVLLRADLVVLKDMEADLNSIGVQAPDLDFSTIPHDTFPKVWSECMIGALSMRLLYILSQVAAPPAQAARAAIDTVPVMLAAPWVQLLLSGWPVFVAFATLAQWASPYADLHAIQAAGTHARAASQAARAFLDELRSHGSMCDMTDMGATGVARSILGAVWRDPDPTALQRSSEEDTMVETSLSELDDGSPSYGVIWGGRAGECRWTEHPNQSVGEPIAVVDTEDLVEVMGMCSQLFECVGVVAEPTSIPDRGVAFSLRRGKPLFAPAMRGESAFARWCSASLESTGSNDNVFAGRQPACPFAHATGVLAGVARRLDAGPLVDFMPEHVIETQTELRHWLDSRELLDGAIQLWTTEWPLWHILGRLQRRIDLLQSFTADGSGSSEKSVHSSVSPWTTALQRVLGFDSEAWRLATTHLAALADSSDAADHIPAALRRDVRCASGSQCAGEMFARLHLLLYKTGSLPLRDPIFIGSEDPLARIHVARARPQESGTDDWDKMLAERFDGEDLDESSLRLAELDWMMPNAHPLQVDRRQLANFVLGVREEVAGAFSAQARCLEWDQPFLLVRAFQGLCRWTDTFSYSEPNPDEPLMGLPGMREYTYGTRHYWGDLERKEGLGIPEETFDLVLVPFVFEHVSLPFLAIKNLAYVLKPGGHIIWSAPMFQMYHGSPHDYYRYTPKGARALAASAGLTVSRIYAPGTLALTSGIMMGMMLPYWSESDALSEETPREGEDSPRYPTNVFALMRK